MHVFWIDPDGALVPRKTLSPGDRHIELTSHEHVWLVMADANAAAEKRNLTSGFRDEGGVLYDTNKKKSLLEEEEKVDFSPVSLVIRPAITSLVADRCTNLIWVPWMSLSLCQKSHPAFVPIYKRRPNRLNQHREIEGDPIQPHIHVQIIDASLTAIRNRGRHIFEETQVEN